MRPQHQQFVDELAKDWNATAAYKRAGYRARGHGAEVNASRLLRKHPEVKAAARRLLAAQLAAIRKRGERPRGPIYIRGFGYVAG